jgi:hypothetical protein
MRIAIGAVEIVPNAPDSLTGDMLPCRFVSGTRRCGVPLYSRLIGIVFNKARADRGALKGRQIRRRHEGERKASDRQLRTRRRHCLRLRSGFCCLYRYFPASEGAPAPARNKSGTCNV